MAGSIWKGAIARRCVAAEARPPREDMLPASDSEPAPRPAQSPTGRGVMGLA